MAITIDGTSGITTPGLTDSGALSVTGATTLSTVLGVASGGTGLTTPGTSGSILTSNGTAWTSTIALPPTLYYELNTTSAGSNVNTAQSIFGVGVTLESSTIYEFESVFYISKSAGTTSHTIGLGFGGTVTLNNINYLVLRSLDQTSFTATNINSNGLYIQTASNTNISGAQTSATVYLMVVLKGIVSVNVGGTFIPQYTLSAAPGGAYTTQIGSYVKLTKLGASGANISIGTWA